MRAHQFCARSLIKSKDGNKLSTYRQMLPQIKILLITQWCILLYYPLLLLMYPENYPHAKLKSHSIFHHRSIHFVAVLKIFLNIRPLRTLSLRVLWETVETLMSTPSKASYVGVRPRKSPGRVSQETLFLSAVRLL